MRRVFPLLATASLSSFASTWNVHDSPCPLAAHSRWSVFDWVDWLRWVAQSLSSTSTDHARKNRRRCFSTNWHPSWRRSSPTRVQSSLSVILTCARKTRVILTRVFSTTCYLTWCSMHSRGPTHRCGTATRSISCWRLPTVYQTPSASIGHGCRSAFRDVWRCYVTSATDSRRHVRCRAGRPTSWVDAEYRAVRRNCRRRERIHRPSGSPDDRLAWLQATRRRFRLYHMPPYTYLTYWPKHLLTYLLNIVQLLYRETEGQKTGKQHTNVVAEHVKLHKNLTSTT